MSLFFTLFRCHDKALRALLHTHIVSDIKNANLKAKNNKLNKTLQNFMFTMLKDPNDIAAKKSLEVMVDLYKKNIWNDAKTVNVISEACFSPSSKMVATAIHFFLGNDSKTEDEDQDEAMDVKSLQHTVGINKKTKSRKNNFQKALATIKKKERSKSKAEVFNFSALHLLNDPQGFAEKLLSKLRQVQSSHAFRYELRLLMLNLITRLVGIHKLLVLNLYDFLVPLLKPSQPEVTAVLAYAAQASHDLVPPEQIEPVIQAIANNFVWANCAAEVICAGLNAIREICARCPLAMNETLLTSLVLDFKRYHDKGVSMATRSLIGLFREFNPEMLRKKDRGRILQAEKKAAPVYGETRVFETVDGLDLLNEESSEEEDLVDENGDQIDVEEDDEEEELQIDLDELNSSDFEVIEEGEAESGEDEWSSIGSDDEQGEDQGDGDDDQVDEDDGSEEEDVPRLIPDEEEKKKKKPAILATERILTDEDFARLREMKRQREAERISGIKSNHKLRLADVLSDSDSGGEEGLVDPSDITAGIKRKHEYNERIESIKAGREGREKYGSKKAKKERTSSTNKEKAKKTKNFKMVQWKQSVRTKSKRSLREKQKILREHVRKQKLKK